MNLYFDGYYSHRWIINFKHFKSCYIDNRYVIWVLINIFHIPIDN